MSKLLNKWIVILLGMALTTGLFAEIEEGDAEEALEKANKQITRLSDPKSKYKDHVIFADVSPVLKYRDKAKKLFGESQYQKSEIFAQLALVYGIMAMDNAKSRYYLNMADKHFMKKYEKEIKAQQEKLLLSAIGLKKKGAVYKGDIAECKMFACRGRRWQDKLGDGTSSLKSLAKLLKSNKKAKAEISYGVRWDSRDNKKSAERVEIIKTYLTDQLGVKPAQVKAEGVGRKLRKDTIEITIRGL